MDIVAILVLVACLYLAFKVVGLVLKSAMWLLVGGALYCLVAPLADWPLPW
jgi:hypothetical protein